MENSYGEILGSTTIKLGDMIIRRGRGVKYDEVGDAIRFRKEAIKKSKPTDRRLMILLEVEWLDPNNEETWLKPKHYLEILNKLPGEWAPRELVIWNLKRAGRAKYVFPPTGLPEEHYKGFFQSNIELVHTKFTIRGAAERVWCMGFKHKATGLHITIYCNGVISIDKEASEVSPEEYSMVWKLAEHLEKVLAEVGC